MILCSASNVDRQVDYFFINLPFWESLETIESQPWPADKYDFFTRNVWKS